MLMTEEEKKCHIHILVHEQKKKEEKKSDVLIICRTFCCHGMFVSLEEKKKNSE